MDKLDTRRSPYPYDTTRVSELLKSKRRVRGIKSCFPCRHRKVKCDGNFPCETCVLRGHPEICCAPSGSTGPSQVESATTNEQFGPGPSQQLLPEAYDAEDINIQSSPAQSSITGIDLMLKRLESIETQISALKTDLRQSRATLSASGQDTPYARSSHREPARDSRSLSSGPSQSLGRNFVEESTGATIFLGNYSDPPAALGCRKVGGDTTVPDALLLEQVMPRTYPFTSLWGPDADLAEICGTLPEDSNIIRYWQNYQTTAYPFYPGLVQLQEFNQALFQFLDRRAEAQLANEKLKAQDLDTSWLALLFSVLACGVQFSDDPVKERDLQSKVFVCSSFQCLRMSDFFTKTDMNQIQALALIGHCLRNNLDANSAWILMGTTLRLAQSIGLHEVTSSQQSSTKTLDYQKRRLWWVLIWQDVFLAFTYDRSPTTVTPSSSFPYEDVSRTEPGNRSYSECILTLIQILLERSKKDHIDMATTIEYKKRMEAILTDEIAAPFLRDKSHCHTLLNHLERLALRVHVCYGIQRLCRLMLEMPSNEISIVGGAEETKRECINRATEAVESFLDMHRLSSLVCRSWAFVHNAVSCAFALQNLGATGSHSRASSVVSRLVVVLENEEVQATWQDLDTNVRYFGPYSRASKALKEAIATTPS